MLRETGSFFHLLKLNETVPLALRDSSNMFVSELPVFTSVNYFYYTALNVWYLLILQRSLAKEW